MRKQWEEVKVVTVVITASILEVSDKEGEDTTVQRITLIQYLSPMIAILLAIVVAFIILYFCVVCPCTEEYTNEDDILSALVGGKRPSRRALLKNEYMARVKNVNTRKVSQYGSCRSVTLESEVPLITVNSASAPNMLLVGLAAKNEDKPLNDSRNQQWASTANVFHASSGITSFYSLNNMQGSLGTLVYPINHPRLLVSRSTSYNNDIRMECKFPQVVQGSLEEQGNSMETKILKNSVNGNRLEHPCRRDQQINLKIATDAELENASDIVATDVELENASDITTKIEDEQICDMSRDRTGTETKIRLSISPTRNGDISRREGIDDNVRMGRDLSNETLWISREYTAPRGEPKRHELSGNNLIQRLSVV